MPDRDEDTGRYTDEYPREDFFDAIKDSGEAVGTREIADSVGCVHDTAYKRLRRLEEAGLVTSRKVGNTLLWMLAEQEDGN